MMENFWEDLCNGETCQAFGRQKAMVNEECRACPYLDLRAGDCLKHRVCRGSPPQTLSRLCEGWKMFYGHALPRLKEIASRLLDRRTGDVPAASAGRYERRPGRNDPCPCGSGRKYKRCCGMKRT